MPRPWSQVAASPEFAALSRDEQDGARQQYFEQVVAPQVDPADVDTARRQFDTDTKLSTPLPDDVKPSAGRDAGVSVESHFPPADAAPVATPAPAARRGTMRAVKPYVAGDERVNPPANRDGMATVVSPDDPNAALVTGGQLVKDLKGGVEQVKGLTRSAGAFAGATDYRATADALQDFDAIDAGQPPTKTGARVMRTDGPSNVIEPGPVAKAYMQGTPEQRAQLRAGATDALTRDKNFIADSVKAVQAYSAEQQKLSGKIPDFTDVRNATGFANWLVRTGVSAAPTMAAAMLGAAAGPLGFAITSGGMAVGDLTQARIEHTAAANDPAQAQPSERAEVAANRDENMARDLASNVGTTAGLAVPYAALDLMGPVGKALRGPGGELAGQTVKQVIKHGVRELPKQMAEEFVNESGQEVAGVAGDILAGERPAVVTGDDAKRVFNAGMAGVAMAPGWHVANVSREAMSAGQASPANQLAGAIDSGTAAVDPQTADAVARGAFDPNRGATPAPAEAPAGAAAQPEPTTQPLSPYDAARAKGFHVEPPYINDAPTVQRSKTTAIFESLGAAYGLPKKAIDAALAQVDGRPLADIGPYLARAVAAFQKRGLIARPVDPEALGTLTAGPIPPVEKEGKKPAEKPADIGVAAVPQGDLAARAAAALEPAPVEEPAPVPDTPLIKPTADAAPESAPEAPAIVGEPINKNWTAFAPESGTLNLPREQLPQVSAEHRGALVNFLNARGIEHSTEEVLADSLKPTQGEFSPARVRKAAEFTGGDRSILVSSDNHVLDGHHQWLAKMQAGEPVKVIRLGAPIQDLLRLAHQFPSSTTARGPVRTEAAAEPTTAEAAPLTQQLADLASQFDEVPTSTAKTFGAVLRSYVKDLNAGRIEPEAVADKMQTYTDLLDRARQSHEESKATPAQVDTGPALEHKQNADGTVIVFGKSAEIKAALPGIRGVTGTRGVTFGRSVAAKVLELLERDANGQTETRQRNAEADVQNVDGDEASVRGPDAQDVSEVRRVRDQGVSGVDGELRGVSGGGRRETEHGAPNRSNRERKGLRAGQRALGNKGGAGSKQDLQSTADGQRGNSDTGAVVRADGTASNDDSQPAESRLVRAGRRDIEAAATQQLGTDGRVPGPDSVGDAVGGSTRDEGQDALKSAQSTRVDSREGAFSSDRPAEPEADDVKFQRAGDSTPEQNALNALSENDDLFQFKKSDADSLAGVAADIDPRIVVHERSKAGARTNYDLTMPDGEVARLVVRKPNPYGADVYGYNLVDGEMTDPVMERPGKNADEVDPSKDDVWIDVSQLKATGDGTKIYAIAANFAHNTGRIFIGDPAGLSDDAMRRRSEQMLSGALKFGTTEHLAPHPRQVKGDPEQGVPPLKWDYADDLANVRALIDVNLAAAENAGADFIDFDPTSGQFLDSEGQPIPRAGLTAAALLPAATRARAGNSTLARGSILRALSREEGGAKGGGDGRSDGLLARVLRLSAVHPEATRDLFYSRQGVDTPTDGARVAEVQKQVDDIRKGWANSPPVVVLASMEDAPEKVRAADQAMLEQGAESQTSAFTWGGKVYIVASQMRSEAMVASAMFHEALGHRGLRGAFGGALDTVLRQTAAALPDKIAAKIKEYGLDPTSQKDRLHAAEEVLAELAETRPSSTWVQKAVAAIKTWLRENVAAFKNLTLSDADVIAQFIVPARNFIERGPAAETGGAEALAFQRTKPGKPGAFTLPEFGHTGSMIEAIQDRYNRWKQATAAVRSQGGKVDEANDFYRAEERYWGKVGSQIDDFHDEMKDFIKAVSKDKLDLGSVALYAYAQHAKERNEWIAAKRPGMPDGGSGMTTADAQQIIDEARHSGTEADLQKHAATLRSWIDGTRAILLRNGLIDQAEHDAWANMFQNYVPLRGLDGKAEGKGTGRGFDVRGKEGKEAKGRKSEAKDIIERIIQDRTRALVRSGKNEVLRSFLQFVLDNPSPNLWKVDAVQSRPVSSVDANGNRVLEEGTAKITDERTVAVKDGGKEIHILVKDQRLREQLQNLHVENVGRVVGAMMYVNRLLSRLYTSLSPTFTVLNGARDLMESTVNIIDELGFLAAPKLWANMPRSIVESYKAEFGTHTRDYQLYRETGGKTGFFDLKNIDTQAAELSALLKDADRMAINPVKVGRKALHVIEAINGGIENATRLAAFKTARQAGKSLSEAARISKNISVNFNRKGTMSPALGAWFLFFNPAVQGTARVIQAVQNPKVVATLGFGMVGIASLALMNAGVGDDDDGVAWWDKIPDEVKERNIVIVLPPGSKAGEKVPGSKIGRYLKIPMPYGYSFFAALANQVADGWRHEQDPKRGRSKSEAVVKAINAFLNSFVPVQELSKSVENPKSAVLAAVPDAFNPVAQNILNVNSFGRKMYPDDATSENQPDSSRYFPGSAGTIFQRGAEGLNKVTGGTRYQSGLVDLTPASIENLARGYGGGPANFSLDVLNAMYVRQNISRPDLDTRRLPFVKQLYGVIDDETDRLVGQQRMDKVQKVMDPLKRAMREGASDDAKALVKDAGTIAGLGGALTTTRQMLAQIRKGELATIGDDKMTEAAKYDRLQEFAGQRRKVMQGFNRAYDDAIELQAAQEATKTRQARPAAAARP